MRASSLEEGRLYDSACYSRLDVSLVLTTFEWEALSVFAL